MRTIPSQMMSIFSEGVSCEDSEHDTFRDRSITGNVVSKGIVREQLRGSSQSHGFETGNSTAGIYPCDFSHSTPSNNFLCSFSKGKLTLTRLIAGSSAGAQHPRAKWLRCEDSRDRSRVNRHNSLICSRKPSGHEPPASLGLGVRPRSDPPKLPNPGSYPRHTEGNIR